MPLQNLLMDFPRELWVSFYQRAIDLNINLREFLERERIIDTVRAQQLGSLDPAISFHANTKPGPQRIERLFADLKR